MRNGAEQRISQLLRLNLQLCLMRFQHGLVSFNGEGDKTGTAFQESALVRVEKTTTTLHAAGDPDVTLANASVYLEAVGHVVVAWIWLEQLLALDTRTGDARAGDDGFAEGKRAAARYFFRFELPRTGPQFDLLDSLETTTLDWTVS